MNKQIYNLEDFAVALVSRLPLKTQREEVLKHLDGECLAKALKIHEEQNELEKFDVESSRGFLEEIVDLEGSEVGREIGLLLEVYDSSNSEELRQRVKFEIFENYVYFKENFEIIEEDYHPPIRKIKKLVEK